MKAIFLGIACTAVSLQLLATDRLSRYYNEEIDLSEEEILIEIGLTIKNHTSDHLVTYAQYLLARRKDLKGDAFEAFQLYNEALATSTKIDDPFLISSILRNQGKILKEFGLSNFAGEKLEDAGSIAYNVSKEYALGVKYDLGWVLENKDRERALKTFLEVIEEAKAVKLHDRVAKCFLEISKMFNNSLEHEPALALIDSANQYVESDWLQARISHNLAHTKYLMEDFESQRMWLSLSLYYREGNERYISLMDLAESFLIGGTKEQASTLLLEAMTYYEDQRLHPDNIKIFKWLHQIYPDSTEVMQRHIVELNKYIEIQEKLEVLLKQQAMLQLFLRLEEQKKSQEVVSFWHFLTLVAACAAILILFTWRIWWFRLRKHLTNKIIELGKRWENRNLDR